MIKQSFQGCFYSFKAYASNSTSLLCNVLVSSFHGLRLGRWQNNNLTSIEKSYWVSNNTRVWIPLSIMLLGCFWCVLPQKKYIFKSSWESNKKYCVPSSDYDLFVFPIIYWKQQKRQTFNAFEYHISIGHDKTENFVTSAGN